MIAFINDESMSAAAKTARSRAAAAAENGGAKIEEGLNLFKSDKFDADVYVKSKCSLNEKVSYYLFSFLIFNFLLIFYFNFE